MIKSSNVTAYSYDSMGRPTVTSTGSSSVTNTYQNDLLSTITHTNTSSRNTVYTLSYGPADLLTGVKVGSRNLVTNQYTSGRWTLARQTYGNGDYWKYNYNNSDQLTLRFTNLTDSSGISYAYLYNSKGQLKQVNRSAVTIANEAITGSTLLGSESYSYDSSDRPVRTTTTDSSGNVTQDISWTYTYDTYGNLRTASDGTTTHTYTYPDAYDETSWQDLLTAYDGNAISYDAIGNPTTWYDGTAFSWVNGRRLASATNTSEGLTAAYTYDADGLRLTKTINGVEHKYLWQGSKLVSEYYDGKELEFFYDESGNPYAFSYKASSTATPVMYYYLTNLQGDIVGILDSSGTTVAAYTYNAWGNILSSSGTLADVNPL